MQAHSDTCERTHTQRIVLGFFLSISHNENTSRQVLSRKKKTGIESHSPTDKRDMIALSFLNIFCRKALSGSLSPRVAFYFMPKLPGLYSCEDDTLQTNALGFPGNTQTLKHEQSNHALISGLASECIMHLL